MDAAAALVQEKLKQIHTLLQNVDKEKTENDKCIDNIDDIHDTISRQGKITPFYQQKLKGIYTKAVNLAECEENAIREVLSKIHEIRTIHHERRIIAKSTGNKDTLRRGAHMKMLQSSAKTLPLWVGKPDSKVPPLCGAIPAETNYIAKSGDMVAALVQGIEEEDNWILAEVIFYHPTGKYEVDDIDEVQKERHTLSRRRVIPLPLMRANPETEPDALFSKGSVVMALYPQTTCFYKAIINQLPLTANDEYEVLFEDSSYPDGYAPPLMVAQRYVIAHRDSKKAARSS